MLLWKTSVWSVAHRRTDSFSISAHFTLLTGPVGHSFWLTTVYGPQSDGDKVAFLQELRDVRAACPGPWLLCGDFNMIYQAADKNNARLNRRSMRRFARLLNDLLLSELFLHGRLFTWSSEREHHI